MFQEIAAGADTQIRQSSAKVTGGQSENKQLEAVIELFTIGLVIINRNAMIIHSNQAADETLTRRDVLINCRGQLGVVNTANAARFREMIAHSFSQNVSCCGVLPIHRPSTGRIVQVWISPLDRQYEFDPAAGRHSMAIAFVVDPDQAAVAPAQALNSIYGLTRAESKLAEALLNGMTLVDYAQKFHVSLNTARTHLKSVFSKTDTNRQAQLIRLLSQTFLALSTVVPTMLS